MRNGDIQRRFHEAARQPTRGAATRPPAEEVRLRVRLTLEEAKEAVEAMLGPAFCARNRLILEYGLGAAIKSVMTAIDYQLGDGGVRVVDPDLPGADASVLDVAGETADQLVIAYGNAEYYGIDLDKAYEIVMEANMRKIPDCGTCEGRAWVPATDAERGGRLHYPCPTCDATGKAPPKKDAGGKVLKPDGWEPPDLNWALRRQYRDPSEVPPITKDNPRVGIDPETGAEALMEVED